jgi:AbrB family looped-hinge helix DNA binding protein
MRISATRWSRRVPPLRSLVTSVKPCHTSDEMARARAVPLRIGPQGRVVIPAAMRRELEIEPGETLMAHVESHRIVLERRAEILERLRDEVRGVVPPGVSVVDELIAERRAEARREQAEHERRA